VSDPATACSVCDRAIDDPRHRAECDDCLRAFHLNLRTDLDLPSCGAAYVSAACGMSVYCNPCGARVERMTAAATARPLRVR
jgi:hypothetical protein